MTETFKTVTGQALKPVTDLHEETPRGRLVAKYLKSIAGGLIFIGAFFLPHFLHFPNLAAYIVAGFGAFIVSQELVVRYAKVVPATILAIVKALKGQNGSTG